MTFAWLECLDSFFISSLGIASAGAKISPGLYQTVGDIGSAGKEVRFIAHDTNALWRISFKLGGWSVSSVSDAEGKRQRDKVVREVYGKIAFRDLRRVI